MEWVAWVEWVVVAGDRADVVAASMAGHRTSRSVPVLFHRGLISLVRWCGGAVVRWCGGAVVRLRLRGLVYSD